MTEIAIFYAYELIDKAILSQIRNRNERRFTTLLNITAC